MANPLSRRAFIACACCAPAAAGLTAVRAAAASTTTPPGLPEALELGLPDMTRLAPSLWVGRLADGVWLHTTTHRLQDGTAYPGNGLIVDLPGGALLLDCWTPEQARALLSWAHGRGQPITWSIATHFHGDRVGGVEALRALDVPTHAHPLTCRLARQAGLPEPAPLPGFTGSRFPIAPGVELFAPGAGHTRDNITVWLAASRVLFGGCLIKSITAPDLGYLADAVPAAWPASVRRLRAAYPDARVTVPGHGTVAGDPIAATLKLLTPA